MPIIVKQSFLERVPVALFRIYKSIFPKPPDPAILNADEPIDGDEKSPSKLAQQLQQMSLIIHNKYLSRDGRVVDYKSLRASDDFGEYRILARNLQHLNLDQLTPVERKAFFLNVYLGLSMHGLALFQPTDLLERKDFWATAAYNIGGHTFTLDDIEHGILRGNSVHPATGLKQFVDGDPRLVWSDPTPDPRIHFALNCGAMSCPAIRVYSSENLDAALDMAAKSFVAEEVKLYPDKLEIHLSRIFEWYSNDFGSDLLMVLAWIYEYTQNEHKSTLGALLRRASGHVDDVAIIYRDFDWSLNTLADRK